jgi:hypothetical protein
MPTERERVDFLWPVILATVKGGRDHGTDYFLDVAAVLEEAGWLKGRR